MTAFERMSLWARYLQDYLKKIFASINAHGPYIDLLIFVHLF